MALIKWGTSPFNSVERVMLGAMRRPASFEELELPNVDISEDQENFYIISELPGMRDEDVKVTVDADVLTISGHQGSASTLQTRRTHWNERAHGEFVRSFSMPHNVKATAISGTFRDGLLELTLPKVAPAVPTVREIPLNTTTRYGSRPSIASKRNSLPPKAVLAAHAVTPD